MKTFKNHCAQGDVLIRRLEVMPDVEMTEAKPENGKIIVTHSETGHNHVMERNSAILYDIVGNPLKAVLVVNEPTPLEHLRTHDTHEPIMFDKGVYEVRRQREYTPEGFRRAQD